MTEADGTKLIREDKHHVYVKRQMRICATWPSFLFTCCLLFIISTPTLVVSNNFLSIRIVLSCFYLFIFYFEKFSTSIWYMLFAIYVKLTQYSTVKVSVKENKVPTEKNSSRASIFTTKASYCIWLTDKRLKKGREEICICLVLAELLHFKLRSWISSAIYTKKLT